MDLRALEQFLKVIEFGSINRAAKELGLSHPALSRSLLQLEHDMGKKLFVPSRMGVVLTEAGSILASHAAPILRQAEMVREELRSEPRRRVAVGMPPALRQLVTLPAIQDIRTQAPGIVVRLHEGLNGLLRDQLKQGVLDVAVMAVEQVPDEEFVPDTQVREPLVLARNARLPAPDNPATFQDAAKFSLVLPSLTNAVRRIVDCGVRRANLTTKITVEAESLGLCLELVRQGIVDQTVTLNSALIGRDATGLRIVGMRDLEIHWAVVMRRQAQGMMPASRVAAIIGRVMRDSFEGRSYCAARAAS